MFNFLEWSKYLTLNDRFFNKENTYFEAVNNQEEYFRGYENKWCMVFLNNMLMTSSYMVFNIPLDLIYDQCYSLHAKTTSFCFTFVLVIVNPIIWFLVLKITWWEALVVNVLMKLLGISRFRCIFHITQFAGNVGLMLTILLKHSFSWISFPRGLIWKNFNVKSNLVCLFMKCSQKSNHTQVPYPNMTS